MKTYPRLITVLFAVACLVSCSEKVSPVAGGDGVLKVATYNVDGLPLCIPLGDGLMGRFVKSLNSPDARMDDDFNLYINDGGPGEGGSLAIGTKIAEKGWDVFGLNEDFNYHKEVWAGLGGYYRGAYQGSFDISEDMYLFLFGRFLQSKPLFEIDGLGLGARKGYCTIGREEMIPWNSDAVYGYISHGGDELTMKGFRYYQVYVDGPDAKSTVDFIILHANAGKDEKDIAARENAYSQLLTFIKGLKSDSPMIMMGDWNTKYNRDNFKELFIDKLNATGGLEVRDVWVEYSNGGVYPPYGSVSDDVSTGAGHPEELDKILYLNREGSPVRLELLYAGDVLDFVNGDGTQLSDHLPVEAMFRLLGRDGR